MSEQAGQVPVPSSEEHEQPQTAEPTPESAAAETSTTSASGAEAEPSPAAAPETGSSFEPEPGPETVSPDEARPGFRQRARQWLRRMLIRLLIALALVGIGFAWAYMLLEPAASRVPVLERQVAMLEQEKASLQKQVQDLEAQLQHAKEAFVQAERTWRRSQLYTEALVDLYAALDGLRTNNPTTAKTRLNLALKRIQELAKMTHDPAAQETLQDILQILEHLRDQDWSTTSAQRRAADILAEQVIQPLEAAEELFRGSP